MKIKIYILAFLPFLACRSEPVEVEYLLNIRYGQPPETTGPLSFNKGMRLLVTSPGSNVPIGDFQLPPGYLGEFFETFIATGIKLTDQYDVHFVYQDVNGLSSLASIFNVPNGAPVYLEPSSSPYVTYSSKITITDLPEVDSIYAIGGGYFTGSNINTGVFTAQYRSREERDFVLVVKPKDQAGSYYYPVSYDYLSYDLKISFKDFTGVWKENSLYVDKTMTPSVVDIWYWSPPFDQGKQVWFHDGLSTGKPVPNAFNVIKSLPENGIFTVYVRSRDYSVHKKFRIGQPADPIEIKPPDISIEYARLTGNLFQLKTTGGPQWIKSSIHTGKHPWTIYGHPDHFQSLELPDLSAYLQGSEKPEGFVNEVTVFKTDLYGYREMLAGYPDQLFDRSMDARCGKRAAHKSF